PTQPIHDIAAGEFCRLPEKQHISGLFARARQSLDVITEDRSTTSVGGWAAKKQGALGLVLGRNWYPITGQKETMCGTMARFKWFSMGREQDWNIFLVPVSSPFTDLFNDVKLLARKNPFGRKELWHCPPGNTTPIEGAETEDSNCFEAEVTPPIGLWTLPPFNYDDAHNLPGGSTLVNNSVCVYGPLVTEEAHGDRPEIHPVNAVWWKSQATSWMLNLQDNSERFESKKRFRQVKGLPGIPDDPGFEPWSGPRQQTTFRVPFEADPQQPQTLNIINDPEFTEGVDSPGDGTTYTVRFNAAPVLTVNEANGDHIRIQVDDACYDDSVNKVKGILSLTSTLDDLEGRGYHLISIGGESRARTSETLPVVAQGREIPGTFRLPAATQWRGDLEVRLLAPANAPEQETLIVTADVASNSNTRPDDIRVQPDKVRLINQPLTRSSTVVLTSAAGKRAEYATPTLGLDVKIETRQFEYGDFHGSVATLVQTLAAHGEEQVGRNATIRRTGTWVVNLLPRYGVTRHGAADVAEESDFAKHVNHMLERPTHDRLNALFGVFTPFTITDVCHTVRNLTRRTKQPEKCGGGASGGVELTIGKYMGLANARLRVSFPDDADVYEVAVRANMADPFGNLDEVQTILYSHSLVHRDEDQLAKTAFDLVLDAIGATPAERTITRQSQKVTGMETATSERQLYMLSVFARRMADNEEVDIQELRALLDLASRYRLHIR
ncbi:MAG: hypothetical protein ACT4O1_16850, partial [Gemmatimonadota bacterium]